MRLIFVLRLMAIVCLGVLGAPPAQAQWKDKALPDSPFVLRGEFVRGATVFVRGLDPDHQSVRHWEAILDRPGEHMVVNFTESLGNLIFDKDAPQPRLEKAGVNARNFPGLKWGEGGIITGGFGIWNYLHFTMQASRPLSCVGFATVVESVAAGDKRGLTGAYCR